MICYVSHERACFTENRLASWRVFVYSFGALRNYTFLRNYLCKCVWWTFLPFVLIFFCGHIFLTTKAICKLLQYIDYSQIFVDRVGWMGIYGTWIHSLQISNVVFLFINITLQPIILGRLKGFFVDLHCIPTIFILLWNFFKILTAYWIRM